MPLACSDRNPSVEARHKRRYTRSVVARLVLAVALAVAIVCIDEPAWAEETPQPASPCSDARAASALPSAPDLAAEESAFERDYSTFSERRVFTERLVSEREARAFEAEQARYLRFWPLTKKLTEDAARETERDFERAVELYLAKVRLTQELAAGQTPTPNF